MKIETQKAKQKRELRENAYGDWLSLKKRGHSMRSACVLLAVDYGVHEDTMSKWLAREAKKRGECKRDRKEIELLHRSAFNQYKELNNLGFTKHDACVKIAAQMGRCWKTIYNWIMDIEQKDSAKNE